MGPPRDCVIFVFNLNSINRSSPRAQFRLKTEAIFRSASSSASVVVRSCARASCITDSHDAVIFKLRAISVMVMCRCHPR